MEFIPLIETIALASIPTLGTYPAVARFISNSPTSRLVTYPAVLVAAGAILLWRLGIVQPWSAIALSSPLYQAIVVRILFRHFVAKHGREPVDAAFNFSRGITADRSFAAGCILYGLFIPMAIYGWSIWGSGLHALTVAHISADFH